MSDLIKVDNCTYVAIDRIHKIYVQRNEKRRRLLFYCSNRHDFAQSLWFSDDELFESYVKNVIGAITGRIPNSLGRPGDVFRDM